MKITPGEASRFRYSPGLLSGLPHDPAMLLAGKGWFSRRRAAARLKLLVRINDRLRCVLHPHERVVFACKGSLASLAERFFAGHAVAYHVNLRALVFTDERVILMQISAGLRPLGLVSELPYALIRRVRSKWSGLLEVTLGNGQRHRFAGVPRADRAVLEKLVMDVACASSASAVMEKDSDGLAHLCPHCFTPLPGWPRACGACGGGIKSALTAALLSLGAPGLGNWYLGHRWFALCELAGAAMLWVVFVIRPLREELAHRDGLPLGAGFWLFALIIVGGAHVTDAVVTHNFARKGHHPARGERQASPRCERRGAATQPGGA